MARVVLVRQGREEMPWAGQRRIFVQSETMSAACACRAVRHEYTKTQRQRQSSARAQPVSVPPRTVLQVTGRVQLTLRSDAATGPHVTKLRVFCFCAAATEPEGMSHTHSLALGALSEPARKWSSGEKARRITELRACEVPS